MRARVSLGWRGVCARVRALNCAQTLTLRVAHACLCHRRLTEAEEYKQFLAWKASQSASPNAKKEATPSKKEQSAAERLRGGNGGQTFTSLLKVVEPETCDLTFYVQLIPRDERQEQQTVRVRCATLGFCGVCADTLFFLTV